MSEEAQTENGLVLNISGKHTVKIAKKASAPKPLMQQLDDIVAELNSVSQKEVLFFFELLGTLNNAGLPVIESLEILTRQTKNPKFKRVILRIRKDMEGGLSLAEAMRKHEKIFEESHCSIIEAGEKSGKLNEILKELIAQLEKMNHLRGQVKSVMMYPIIVICVMILLTVVLLIFVVPKLESVFEGSENLPLPTRILVGSSDVILSNWLPLGILIFLIVGGFTYWKQTRSGKKTLDNASIYVPIMGKIIKKMILSRVARMFSLLLTAGVPIVESLKISANAAGNSMYKEKLLLASDDITKGISIAENLSDQEKIFPEIFVNMIAIGEKTASLDSVMGRVAGFYDEELEREIKSLSKLMEPIILLFIATGAVFMILAVYLPIMQMNDHLM